MTNQKEVETNNVIAIHKFLHPDTEILKDAHGVPNGTRRIIEGIEFQMHWSELHYNKSWDMLMRVVEKIESMLLYVQIEGSECTIMWRGSEPDDAQHLKWLKAFPCISRLDIDNGKMAATYTAVTSFIAWYNHFNPAPINP